MTRLNAKGNPGSKDRTRKAHGTLRGRPGRRDHKLIRRPIVDKEDIGIIIALVGIVLAVMLFGFGVVITLMLAA
jgi:hypothetical protein